MTEPRTVRWGALLALPLTVAIGATAFPAAAATVQPGVDAGALAAVTTATGARTVWAATDAAGLQITGAGVDVALVDTGVASMPGLDQGNVVAGADLSGASAATRDGFGHGTYLAGIIAGRGNLTGMAPGARVVDVKVAGTDGAVRPAQVVRGISWVVEHAHDGGRNIRVLNVSYSASSPSASDRAALSAAVRRAWASGILVVAAAGNNGLSAPALSMPAADPTVLAVGASTSRGTLRTSDDGISTLTNGGSQERSADVLAPGASIISLRAPGSVVDRDNPVSKTVGPGLVRGSGTSQAAAVVSGAAALLLQAHPELSPDAAANALIGSARPGTGTATAAPSAQAGLLDVAGALVLADAQVAASRELALADAAQGSSDSTWSTRRWSSVDWSTRRWSSVDWSTRRWSSVDWSTRRWSSVDWSTRRWSSVDWSTRRWSSVDWSTRRWSSVDWSTRRWSSVDWSTRRWSSVDWSTRRWSSVDWSTSCWS